MPRAKKVKKAIVEETPVEIEEKEFSVSPQNTKDCCNDCGRCDRCLGNKKNYTPLLMLLLLISSFLLGALVTKVSSLHDTNNTGGYPMGSTTGGNTQPAQAAGVKPLHVAKAIGMNADDFKKCLDSGKYTQQVATDLADGQKAGVSGTPAIFINGISIVGAQPYSVFKTTIDQELATARTNEDILQQIGDALAQKAYAQVPSDTIEPTTPTPAPRVDVGVGSFPLLGNKDAKVTVIEFADFQCPYCEKYYSAVEKQLIKEYVNTGKIKYTFRNYAFLGQDSNTSAEGSYCANDQGKFWAYHNFLYEHQGPENSGQFTKENLE